MPNQFSAKELLLKPDLHANCVQLVTVSHDVLGQGTEIARQECTDLALDVVLNNARHSVLQQAAGKQAAGHAFRTTVRLCLVADHHHSADQFWPVVNRCQHSAVTI